MTNFDDNLIFDRLADGELTLAERQELLSSLERAGSAEGWRRCALTLLESQVLRREFKAFVTPDAPISELKSVVPTPLPARPRRVRSLEGSLALAASALVAFGVGWVAKSSDVPLPPSEQVTLNHEPAHEPVNSRDAVTLVVNDEQGKQQRVRLPLVDAGELGKQWAHLSPDVPVNVKTGLREHGFDVQSKQRFAPLFFEQGRQLVPMVVPVSDTYVVPVNRPVY